MMRKGSKHVKKEEPKKVEDLDLGSTNEEISTETEKSVMSPKKFDVHQYLAAKKTKTEVAAVENADTEEPNPEMKGSAANQFEAAASIVQMTKQDDDQSQTSGLTPEQAMQMAQGEEITQVMISDGQLNMVPQSQQYTDYEVPEGDRDIVDSLFEGE